MILVNGKTLLYFFLVCKDQVTHQKTLLYVFLVCKDQVTHQKAYREAREEYQNPITRESFRSFTADM